MNNPKQHHFYSFFKRIFDLLGSFLGLLVLFFPMLVVAILVKATSKGHVFFCQDRLGKNGRVFRIIKFRSMREGSELQGDGIYSFKNDARITPFGKFLRKTNIDEWPQLFNILRGDMSFVGPRPPLINHPHVYQDYDAFQVRRFAVRPGLTGLAAIKGRRGFSWDRRIRYDVYYVDHLSFGLDFKIFFGTLGKIFHFNNTANTQKTVEDVWQLETMFITNDSFVARVAENAGVDDIFIDLETLGKAERQKGRNAVLSHHCIADIAAIKPLLSQSKLMVRVNPINPQSRKEINAVIKAGADIIMLPYFKTLKEVNVFLKIVGGRVQTRLLLETKEAVKLIDALIEDPRFDDIHIGLNDLHLSYGLPNMFELYRNGTVNVLADKLNSHHIRFGIGGISYLGTNEVIPAEQILMEQKRLNSHMVILSRGFCPRQDQSEDAYRLQFSQRLSAFKNEQIRINTLTKEQLAANTEALYSSIHKAEETK
jgi:lipopolysaccharide/colanic/teichoic acid biosynthesis glycosyltransferase/2-keto-3-deoxy-L-rhamnonate aldolase RhmA